MIRAGDEAPPFALPGDDGSIVSLADLRGRWVVLYFYPRADTPGCTIESCEFRDAVSRFADLDAVVLGASPDTVAKQRRFKEKHDLGLTLLADADHQLAEAWGVWREKSFMGRKFMGVVRTTFLVDPDGRVARVFEKVSPQGHAAEVAAAIEELRASR
jgi:peroxiredoxin Q/BCP